MTTAFTHQEWDALYRMCRGQLDRAHGKIEHLADRGMGSSKTADDARRRIARLTGMVPRLSHLSAEARRLFGVEQDAAAGTPRAMTDRQDGQATVGDLADWLGRYDPALPVFVSFDGGAGCEPLRLGFSGRDLAEGGDGMLLHGGYHSTEVTR